MIKNYLIGINLLQKYAKTKVGEESNDAIIMFIADEFQYKLTSLSEAALFDFNNYILIEGQKNGSITVHRKEEPVFELAKEAIIVIKKQWNEYHYKSIPLAEKATYSLFINGAEHASRYFDDSEQFSKLSEAMATLFDEEVTTIATAYDKVKALYCIFKSPRMANFALGYSKMTQVVHGFNAHEGMAQEDEIKTKEQYYNMIINDYLNYLWDKYANKADSQYIMGFESFIDKNKDSWKKNGTVAEESLNLVSQDHEEVVELFKKFKEPSITWQKAEKDPLHRQESNSIMNRLNSFSKTITMSFMQCLKPDLE